MKEQELISNEQRLLDTERILTEEHDKSKVGQQRMTDLSNQLQKRHEEVTQQRRQLEERQQQCDEYAARLKSWEDQLEHVTNILQQGGNDGPER